jgi:protocatechuate 3,4-dioxygenase alpha subunit
MAKQTASQTIGPYFAYCLTPEPWGKEGITSNRLAGADTPGEHVVIQGRVLDGAGAPVGDALVELWQANAAGRYRHPRDDRAEIPLDDGFTGFGRAMTGEDGGFSFETVKPGRVPGQGNQTQAPHVSLIVQARGMLSHAFTRFYFADEQDANAADPVLALVEESRRPTLIAAREETPGGAVYRLDIVLQGDGETVFFDA